MKIMLSLLLALLVSCTTLDQSMKLGAATGVLAGAAATYGAYGAVGQPASSGEIGLGASVGIGLD